MRRLTENTNGIWHEAFSALPHWSDLRSCSVPVTSPPLSGPHLGSYICCLRAYENGAAPTAVQSNIHSGPDCAGKVTHPATSSLCFPHLRDFVPWSRNFA